MSLAFHASPPAGHWINDPNGLVYSDGAYRLFAQHRADGPAFRETGWARFSSPDLLNWTFDGPVIGPADGEWAYSGSVQLGASGLEAVHTAHDAGFERQVRRTSRDGGLSWSASADLRGLGQPRRNSRDPYRFQDDDGWALLLAKPCDWTEWADQPPSSLELYRSRDGDSWRSAGTIGPWRPAGVMWEVPVLARLDGHDVLFISEVDRRDGGAECAVRAWIGQVRPDGFVRHPGVPPEGQLVDQGPDFYALMAATATDWPGPGLAFVAWFSSWQTARAMSWPAFFGGPISLPRRLAVEGTPASPRLTNRPFSAIAEHFTRPSCQVPGSGKGSLTLEADRLIITVAGASSWASFDIDWVGGVLAIERGGPQPWRRRCDFLPARQHRRQIEIYVDGPVIELFLVQEGISVSLALTAQASPYDVRVAPSTSVPGFDWLLLG